MCTHIFQPLGSGGMRLGQTGQVHNAMFNFKMDGTLGYTFDGEKLLNGETDGSSYLNGGMRATHTAGGYTALDPSCPMFIRGDTVFVPTVFVSWLGQALDEKTPLLRSMVPRSRARSRASRARRPSTRRPRRHACSASRLWRASARSAMRRRGSCPSTCGHSELTRSSSSSTRTRAPTPEQLQCGEAQ